LTALQAGPVVQLNNCFMLVHSWKRALLVLAVIGAAAALTGGAIGLAQAQADPTPGMEHHACGLYAAAAQAIGITPGELRQELPGKTLAEVAEAHGKSATDVAAVLKSEANEHVDAKIDRLMTHVVPVKAATATTP
jgi:hypothetical protein